MGPREGGAVQGRCQQVCWMAFPKKKSLENDVAVFSSILASNALNYNGATSKNGFSKASTCFKKETTP